MVVFVIEANARSSLQPLRDEAWHILGTFFGFHPTVGVWPVWPFTSVPPSSCKVLYNF